MDATAKAQAPGDVTVDALKAAAQSLEADAVLHKRYEAEHRRRARAARRRLAALQKSCADAGIELIIESTEPWEVHSDGRTDSGTKRASA